MPGCVHLDGECLGRRCCCDRFWWCPEQRARLVLAFSRGPDDDPAGMLAPEPGGGFLAARLVTWCVATQAAICGGHGAAATDAMARVMTAATGVIWGPVIALPASSSVPDSARGAAGYGPASVHRKSGIDILAQRLVARVIRTGGVLELDTEDDETDYKRLITASKRAPNLPFGKQLRIRTVGPYLSD